VTKTLGTVMVREGECSDIGESVHCGAVFSGLVARWCCCHPAHGLFTVWNFEQQI